MKFNVMNDEEDYDVNLEYFSFLYICTNYAKFNNFLLA